MIYSVFQLPDTYSKSKVKLPRNREQVFNYGFYVTEPEYVPAGRYTLTQIIECIADHYKDKQLYTAEVLANRVKIDVKLMGLYMININLIGILQN